MVPIVPGIPAILCQVRFDDMDLEALQAEAMRIHDRYDELNHRERNRTWSREEFVLGFMGDVGDLAKLVLAAEGARGDIEGGKQALGHELADCLWSVLVLAKLYDVDLPAEFSRLTAELDERIGAKLAALPRSS
jgi:NTP pyrophosphatase (non-canonical NTP hydrolase)